MVRHKSPFEPKVIGLVILAGAEFRGALPPVNRTFVLSAIALKRGLRQILARRGQMRESLILTRVWNLSAQPVRGVYTCALAVAGFRLMFLSAAVWNGFFLIFFDTGAYVLEGLGHIFLVQRAP